MIVYPICLILSFVYQQYNHILYKSRMGPYLAHPNTEKHTLKGQNQVNKLKYSLCQMQGWRRYMEDASICQTDIGNGNSLFAVFDGHGGSEVAKFVEKIFVAYLKGSKFYKEGKFIEALDDTFRKIDQIIDSKEAEEELKQIRKKNQHINTIGEHKISNEVGCTANVVLITPKKIYIANAGDSRSVLSRSGRAIGLSIDNKPELPAEYQRIKLAGGQVINGRVNGNLNLSRSFGDFAFKQNKAKKYDQQLIICKPQIKELIRSKEDQFIIIACDGIWQKYLNDSQSLITKINNQKKSTDTLTVLKNLMDFILAKQTIDQLGCDNMTAIIIQFI